MIALYKDPEGDNIFSRSGPMSSGGELADSKTFALQQKVKELESQLDHFKVTRVTRMQHASHCCISPAPVCIWDSIVVVILTNQLTVFMASMHEYSVIQMLSKLYYTV